jgi:hypothetical protein
VTRARAADDFATIRARLDELRRERAQVSAGLGSIDDRPEPLSSCREWRGGPGAAAPTALNLSPESNRVEPSIPAQARPGTPRALVPLHVIIRCIARLGGRVPITSRSTAAHCAPIDGRPLPFKITLHWANPADTG